MDIFFKWDLAIYPLGKWLLGRCARGEFEIEQCVILIFYGKRTQENNAQHIQDTSFSTVDCHYAIIY